MIPWELTTSEFKQLAHMFTYALGHDTRVRVAWDDGLMVKIGEGMWSAPLGRPEVKSPADESTPSLVREYAERKMADARGEVSTKAQHERHCTVVDELRARGTLD